MRCGCDLYGAPGVARADFSAGATDDAAGQGVVQTKWVAYRKHLLTHKKSSRVTKLGGMQRWLQTRRQSFVQDVSTASAQPVATQVASQTTAGELSSTMGLPSQQYEVQTIGQHSKCIYTVRQGMSC